MARAVAFSSVCDSPRGRSRIIPPQTWGEGLGKGLLISFLLHMVVVAVALISLNGTAQKQQETISVVLTDSELPGGANKAGDSGALRTRAKIAPPAGANRSPASRKVPCYVLLLQTACPIAYAAAVTSAGTGARARSSTHSGSA